MAKALREPALDAAVASGIPVLDLAGYLAGVPGALQPLAAELRDALERVGFYYIHGHGVPRRLIDAVFTECARFHAQPLDRKMAVRGNEHNVGYMPVNGYVSRSSRVEKATRPNFVEAFFLKRDLPLDHPDVVAGVRYRCANPWPDAGVLPGFRETVVAYLDAMEGLCKRMLPVYATALDLPPDYFDAAFREPQYTLRLSHYPPADEGGIDQYGLAPHTDSSFLTMLPQSELPGLAIGMSSGEWVDAPVVPGTFLVNSGDMLRRWTNHRFLSTPHRVVNRNAGRDRYAIPFFFDATHDFPMACLPTCQGPDDPPRYEPTTYGEYMRWFARQYDHVRDRDSHEPADPGVPTVG
ncbi:MAG: isopenicillin N synthase family oxygenase [Deltaproteobacteria bacterium]|nr:isopenicillin N synthase family oxygenase [Deltaproteobacteria bacterium]